MKSKLALRMTSGCRGISHIACFKVNAESCKVKKNDRQRPGRALAVISGGFWATTKNREIKTRLDIYID